MGQRRAAPENVFRYMCGIAWRKVRLRRCRNWPGHGRAEETERKKTRARRRQTRSPPTFSHVLTDAETAKAYEDAESAHGDEPPETSEGRDSGALWWAWRTILTDRTILRDVLQRLLECLPDGSGTRA